MRGCGLDFSGTGQRQVVGCVEHLPVRLHKMWGVSDEGLCCVEGKVDRQLLFSNNITVHITCAIDDILSLQQTSHTIHTCNNSLRLTEEVVQPTF